MENTPLNPTDVQNTIDNFEAVVKSGDVKLLAQDGELKLYRGLNDIEYIYDGNRAYSENSSEFAPIKNRHFGKPNTDR